MTPEIIMATDGSCLGNPGPGGWAFVLEFNGVQRHTSGHSNETTNNRMELCAVIEGLKTLKRHCKVTILTDSRYV
jgi:ribonuclease HI